MSVRVNGSDVADVSREANGVGSALLGALRRAHLLERFALQYALPIGRGAVAHVESGVGEEVGDAQPDAAGGNARGWRERSLERRLAVARGVAGGEAVDDEVTGGRAGVLET